MLTDSAKVSGSPLSLMLFLEEERSTEHLQEVVSHVGTGAVCPVSVISLVLKEFSFPAHYYYICCGTLLKLVSQRISNATTTASTLTELDLFSLLTFTAWPMSTMFK